MKVFCLDSCLRRNDESGMTFSGGSLILQIMSYCVILFSLLVVSKGVEEKVIDCLHCTKQGKNVNAMVSAFHS